MTETTSNNAHRQQTPHVFRWIRRWLLLVPEVLLLSTLLLFYMALGQPQLLAVLSAILIVLFVMRVLGLYMARVASDAGRYADAHALLSMALAIYPWSADGQALRGVLALTRGDAAEAEHALCKAIELMPGQPSFYVALSSALLELNRPREAADMAHQALFYDSDYAQAYFYLAEADRAVGAEAHVIEQHIRSGIAIASESESQATLQCTLAAHLLSERRFAEASLALRSAEAQLPKCSMLRQAELRFLLGELLVTQGQVERAREHFQGANELDPHGRFAAAAWRAAHMP